MARLKKFLQRAAIGSLLVFFVLIGVFAFFNWRASRQVEERLASLREAGKPTSLADLQPDPVRDEDNAAKVVEGQASKQSMFGGLSWSSQQGGLVAFRRNQARTRGVRILAAWQDAGRDPDAKFDELGLPESVTTHR